MARRITFPTLAIVTALAMLAFGGVRQAHADQRDFTLINGSASVTIVHVYVSVAVIDAWEEDILGQDVLAPGDSVSIHFSKFDSAAGQCLYDIRVDGAGGEQGVIYAVDLCATDTVTFS